MDVESQVLHVAHEARRQGVLLGEQRKPLQRSTVNVALTKYGEVDALPLAAHPHMLRHACG